MIIVLSCVFISMANFSNNNLQIINFAYDYPCVYEDIYISNLKEGEILISYDPSFMQNSNGLVIGIDSRFTDFYIIDKNQDVVKSLNLEWINDCENSVDYQNIKDNHLYLISYSTLFTLISLIIIFIIKRRKK